MQINFKQFFAPMFATLALSMPVAVYADSADVTDKNAAEAGIESDANGDRKSETEHDSDAHRDSKTRTKEHTGAAAEAGIEPEADATAEETDETEQDY